MGGNSSKATSTTDLLTNIATNVTTKMASACSGSSVTNQNISQIAGGNANMDGVSQSSSSTVDLTCLMSDVSSNDLQTQMAQQIQSELTAKLSGLGIANDTETNSKVTSITNAVTNISTDKIKNCLASAGVSQNISQIAGGNASMKNVSQAAVTTVVANCIMKDDAVNQAISDFDQTVATKSTSENTGIDPLAPLTALFSSLGLVGTALTAAPYVLSVCCCLIIVICCFLLLDGGGGVGGHTSAPPPPPIPLYHSVS